MADKVLEMTKAMLEVEKGKVIEAVKKGEAEVIM